MTYFAVSGPGVNEFIFMDRIARLLGVTLNAANDFCPQANLNPVM